MGHVTNIAAPRVITREDFASYLNETAPQHKVLPAAAFTDELKRRLFAPATENDGVLPWAKTHHHVQFRPGEVSLWMGPSGHGKSQMTGMAMASLMSQGYRVCIASFEMKPVVQLHRMVRQLSCGDSPSAEWVEASMQWLDGRLWFYDQQGSTDTTAVLAVCRYAAERLKVRHIVIDSLMKCVRGEDDFNGQKDFVDQLTAIARDTGLHIHLVHHVRKLGDESRPPGKLDAKGSGAITDQVDNVLICWRNKAREVRVRTGASRPEDDDAPDALLIVEKQRNGEWEGQVALWFHAASMQYCPDARREPIDLLRLSQ